MAFKPKKKTKKKIEKEIEEEVDEEVEEEDDDIVPKELTPETKSKPTYFVREIPTEVNYVIHDSKTGKDLDVLTALTKILNLLEEFEE